MTLPYRLLIAVFVLIAAFTSGFFYGQKYEQSKTQQETIAAYKNAGEIQNEINSLDDYNLCLAANGSLSKQCEVLLRRLEQTTKGE